MAIRNNWQWILKGDEERHHHLHELFKAKSRRAPRIGYQHISSLGFVCMSACSRWLLMFSVFTYRLVFAFSLWTRITKGGSLSGLDSRDRSPVASLPSISSISSPTISSHLLSSVERRTHNTKFDAFTMFSGTLRLCPAGGPSFFEAFQLVCPMKRRKRSISRASSRKMSGSPSEELPLLMEKCCKKGCDFEALHRMCDPFDF